MSKKPRKSKDEPEVAAAKGTLGKDVSPERRNGLILREMRKRAGRPAYQPTDDERTAVEDLAMLGLTHAGIAGLTHMDENTLRKHFAHELDVGSKAAISALPRSMLQRALAGDTTAAIFVLKTRAGWREQPTQLEVNNTSAPLPEDEKKLLVDQILQLVKPQEPIDVTPPKVIDHE